MRTHAPTHTNLICSYTVETSTYTKAKKDIEKTKKIKKEKWNTQKEKRKRELYIPKETDIEN